MIFHDFFTEMFNKIKMGKGLKGAFVSETACVTSTSIH